MKGTIKEIIGFINPCKEKKTLKEILDKAFESSNLDYEVSKPNDSNVTYKETLISEAIKNTPELEVELKNCDYFA